MTNGVRIQFLKTLYNQYFWFFFFLPFLLKNTTTSTETDTQKYLQLSELLKDKHPQKNLQVKKQNLVSYPKSPSNRACVQIQFPYIPYLSKERTRLFMLRKREDIKESDPRGDSASRPGSHEQSSHSIKTWLPTVKPVGEKQELCDRIMNGKTLNVNLLPFFLKILIHSIKEAWMEFLNEM